MEDAARGRQAGRQAGGPLTSLACYARVGGAGTKKANFFCEMAFCENE